MKKLKEQLSLITGQRMQGNNASAALFRAFAFLQNLLQKVAQLEDAWAKKDKFIQSSRMIVKFREDHISRLEKTLKNGGSGLSRDDQNALIGQLRQEIELLKEQVDQHPRVAKYATENHALREENKRLRLLDSVKQALEIDAQTAADLEGDFLKALETKEGSAAHLSPMTSENTSSVSIERLKAQLTQKQTEHTSTVQAYEEFKELTKKKILEMESNIRYLEKANQSLEKILEATKAHKRQEVSQLNKMHVETIKNLTTPTKAYNLRSRLVPHLSPEGTPVLLKSTDSVEEQVDEIFNEPPPPEMSELAYEAIAEELRMVQLFSTERALWSKEQQRLGSQIKSLEKDLVEGQSKNEVLKSEVHDLRVVLQSADKELNAVKVEYSSYKEKQELEWRQISSNMIEMRLQLDNVRLEYEKLLEEKRFLQDSHDNLQEVMKFESEEYKQSLSECKKENTTLQSELTFKLCQKCLSKHTCLTVKELLQDDLTHATEEIGKLTETLGRQEAIVQTALREAAANQSVIENLEQQVRLSLNADLSRVLETQDAELHSLRSSVATLEMLVNELNEERSCQLCELENMKLEKQNLLNQSYSSQKQRSDVQKGSSKTMISFQEVDILRKQVELLTEENGKLAGHHNLQQKIQYMVRLKKDNTKLVEENELLRLKLLNMEETFKRTESSI
uniref:Uncharacterized protein n=1 Tax=Erpetoichthys calabaricus TaxID=27687 RepID=A0A8C4SL06_ERPCA